MWLLLVSFLFIFSAVMFSFQRIYTHTHTHFHSQTTYRRSCNGSWQQHLLLNFACMHFIITARLCKSTRLFFCFCFLCLFVVKVDIGSWLGVCVSVLEISLNKRYDDALADNQHCRNVLCKTFLVVD